MTTQNKNVPALRFTEFDDDWEEKRLKEMCNKILDGTHFSPRSTEGTRKYLTSKNIRNSGLDISNINYISEEEHKNIYKRCPVKFGDVLLTKDGANTGNCCINTLEEEFSLLSSVAVLNGREDLLNNIFLLQILQSSNGINTINSVMAGQAISRITLEKINNFKFPIPTLPEQQKIAAFLTAVDKKIQQLAKKKDLSEQYKKGVMQKILNQEIRFKDSDGSDFADWEEKKLGDAINNKSEKYNPEKEKVSYKCIELEHLASETPSLLGYVDSSNSGSIKNKFEKGDVLFGKLRPYLKKYLQAPFDGVCSSEIWVLKGNHIINAFLFQLIQTDEFISLANQSTGSKMPRADWNVISATLFAIPSKPEQQKIADFLSAIDDKINIVNQQFEKTKEYKKSLLQKMFI